MNTDKDDASMNVGLTETAQRILEDVSNARGMKKRVIFERVLTWLTEQDDMAQGVILGQVPPDYRQEVAYLILRHTRPDIAVALDEVLAARASQEPGSSKRGRRSKTA